MDGQEIDNNEKKDMDLSYVIFYLFFIVSLFSIIFLQFFSHRTLPNAIKELISISTIIILPLLFPKLKIGYKLLLAGILFIIFTSVGYTVANQPDLELGALVYIPGLLVVCLLLVFVSHHLTLYVSKIEKIGIKILIIIIEIIFILLLAFQSYNNINSQVLSFHNYNTLNEIQCKGSYTTTNPADLKILCDEIISSVNDGNNWGNIKTHCYEVVEKIKIDPYYFDYYSQAPYTKLRIPENYKACAVGTYAILKPLPNPYSDYSNLELPELKDPLLCDHLNKSFDTYYARGGDTRDNCYSRVAIATGNTLLCEKTEFPQSCYAYVALMRKDPSVCDKATDLGEKYWCRAEITNDPLDCDKIVNSAYPASYNRVACYANIATRARDLSICDDLVNAADIQNCKQWANV